MNVNFSYINNRAFIPLITNLKTLKKLTLPKNFILIRVELYTYRPPSSSCYRGVRVGGEERSCCIICKACILAMFAK